MLLLEWTCTNLTSVPLSLPPTQIWQAPPRTWPLMNAESGLFLVVHLYPFIPIVASKCLKQIDRIAREHGRHGRSKRESKVKFVSIFPAGFNISLLGGFFFFRRCIGEIDNTSDWLHIYSPLLIPSMSISVKDALTMWTNHKVGGCSTQPRAVGSEHKINLLNLFPSPSGSSL